MGILQGIIEIRKRFDSMPPVARQIWFVDRRAEYHQAFAYCKTVDENEIKSLYSFPPLFGLPIFNVKSAEYDATMPECCKMPGIWAVMSDGTTEKIDAVNHAP